ncbi:hypothetical protein DFH29DRAFT_1069958 [Suillus ampliporus]|nr:hypothetical protein DFH29DRAFT_1069958 [Suillus ampliporus]
MPDERRSQCYCQQCSRHSDGFKYQTHQVIAKHRKKYGPGPKAQGYQQLKRVPSICRPLAPQTNVAEPAGPHVVEGLIEEYYGEHEIQAHDDHELQYNADQFEGGNNEAHPVPELPDHPPAAEGQINQELPLIRRWQQQLPAPDQNFALVDLPNIREPGADQDEGDAPALVPIAFQEKAEIRYAYLTAVMANVYGNLPWLQATNLLNHTLNGLFIANALPIFPRPVRALASAKRHLGIDPDQWITQYAICPECWKHHSPAQLQELPTPNCTVHGCTGLLYTERRDAKGRLVRTAVKINPQTSLIGSLQRMLMRPGFARSIRDSRNDIPRQNDDENFVMTDIHDGTLWHELETNIVREVGEFGAIRDWPREGRNRQNLTEHRYGLHLTMNCDWLDGIR